MSWKASELDALLPRDVDDIVERGRTLGGKDRTAALRDSIVRLETSAEPLDRLKIVLFVQTLLAFVPDGKLAPSVAESAANELSNVVVSASDPEELKRSALSALALLFLKATELTSSANTRMRAAFTSARDSRDPEIRGFARRTFPADRVHTRRSTSSPSEGSGVLLIHGRDK
jgi:hypothetical protein